MAAKVGAIMGVDAGEQIREVAFVKCAGTCEVTKQTYNYNGLHDCVMINMMQKRRPEGLYFRLSRRGLLRAGLSLDAIHIVDGVAVVDKDACKACGKCIAVCPRHLIELVPYVQKHLVQCSSRDKGKDVMSVCSVGCIGCKMCEKVCEFDAVKVVDNIAHIDPSKCTTAESARRSVRRK